MIHTQVVIEAPPDLAQAFHAKYNADMDFFARRSYNAAQIMVTVLDKVLSENKPATGENLRAALFEIKHFQGLIPMTFNSNTATVPIAINEMKDGKEVTLTKATAQ